MTCSLYLLLEDHAGFLAGSRVQTGSRPEYGGMLRMVAVARPNSARYEKLRTVVFAHPACLADASRVFVTQEGAVFGMDGATCPSCGASADLSDIARYGGFGALFVCPSCDVRFDEPVFTEADYLTTFDDESGSFAHVS